MQKIYVLNRTKFTKTGEKKSVEQSFFNELQPAQAKFHRNIGADMDDTTLSGSFTVITDTKGNIYDNFGWGEIIEPQTVAE